ncbi:MAG: hypothetical protein HOP19_02395 [Acidobacteria bacterium]|nr:hypothetical protein [Acidobacteriota bacterium]
MNLLNPFPLRRSLFLLALSLTFGWPDVAKSHLAQSAVTRVSVLTQHNDNDRTGWNPYETQLTPQSISGRNQFGKLFDLPVDGFVYAQPLVVSDLLVAGKKRNVVVVVTEHNSVYLFDADSGARLWQRNFGPSVPIPNPSWNQPPYIFQDLTNEVGITSTPVIDRATQTLYFAHMTWDAHDGPQGKHWLRAIDLMTQQDKFGSPVRIEGTVKLRGHHLPTMGRHGVPDTLDFVPNDHLQRAALLLSQGRVFVAYAGHGDKSPFQGWVFAYDAQRLSAQPPLVWGSTACSSITTAPFHSGGIWQGGMGLTADAQGGVYLMTGNGKFHETLECYGDSVVKLAVNDSELKVADYFTPCNQALLDPMDIDLGASGVMHLPGTELILGGGKQGRLYLLDQNRMGKFGGNNSQFDCPNANVRQEFQVGCDISPAASDAPRTPCNPPPKPDGMQSHHIHNSPIYWRSAQRGPVVYVWAENDVLRALPFDEKQGKFVSAKTNADGQRQPLTVSGCKSATDNPMEAWTTGQAKAPGSVALASGQIAQLHTGMTGGMLSLSSNQDKDGILWATTAANNDANQHNVPGILRAYDANDLQHELWNSYQIRARDDLGNYAKFTPPTVANGKVYVATFSQRVSVYGLHPAQANLQAVNLLKDDSFENGEQHWTGKFQVNNAFPYHGTQQGVLCPNLTEDAMVAQTLTAQAAARYTLTAYCATNILPGNLLPGRLGPSPYRYLTLGVSVNSRVVARQLKIATFAGYQKYTLRFAAPKGAQIKVWYYAPRVRPVPNFVTVGKSQPTPYAIIDNISLAPDFK